MYTFIDTTQPASKGPLPPEAFSYNGKWPDREVQGFRTLSVSGRGIMHKEITEKTRNGFDGSSYVRRTVPARDITIRYAMSAPDAHTLMERINQLNALLSEDSVKIIFNDESDKYFIGTALNASEPDPGRLSFTGEIRIRCTDPYKYAIVQKPVAIPAGTNKKITIPVENAGNADAYLRFELSGTRDNGYIGIASAYGGMEFGDIEQIGTKFIPDAQEWLIRSKDVIRDWPASDGDYQHPLKKIRAAPDPDRTAGKTFPAQDWLSLGSAKFHAVNNWCRRSVDIQVPRDSTQQAQAVGTGGASSFYVSLFHWFETSNAAQCGEQAISFLNINGTTEKEIACLTIHKNSVSNQAEYLVWINGKLVHSFPFVCDFRNPFAQGRYGNNDFHKDGGRFRYYFNGKYYGHTDESLKNTVCNVIRISMAHFPGRDALTRNYLGRFEFRKDHIAKTEAMPVTFPAKSKITIDGQYGKFYLDGHYKPEHEVIGSKYFMIPPGTSNIRLTTSSWFIGAMTGTIYVQERWL